VVNPGSDLQVAERIPDVIPNRIGGTSVAALDGATVEKRSPHDGRLLWKLASSREADVDAAVGAAAAAYPGWAAVPAVQRGELLYAICRRLEDSADLVAAVVAAETGKAPRDALAEVGAAVACGRFFAAEGQRSFGRTMPSGTPDRYAMTVRQPVGVAGLIIAANTPIANVAWKVFPALICGNAAVLKAAEDTPATAWLFGELASAAGLPDGVLNVVQGLGPEAGSPLVCDERVAVVSFTGSTSVGREIAVQAGRRLARVSLELGGKNPFVVCSDADLDHAVHWAVLSAFSNAGQRCASASRMIVDGAVYDEFTDRLVERARRLRVGPTDEDDLGPVINERAVERVLSAVDRARKQGATIRCGGVRLDGPNHSRGSYVAPTVVTDVRFDGELSREELFGPLTVCYRVNGFTEALAAANDSPYGLTAAIHTNDWNRAMQFAMQVQAGVAVVNGGTFGSEPHMPFGGVKASGNGSREPGTEALDVYSTLKDLYLNVQPGKV
jgi:aldehyde dehydrogenase (NAD+)